jgi:hypothetical protein
LTDVFLCLIINFVKKNIMENQLKKITSEINSPCVTISLNTHRTHPDNIADAIELKKLLKEAETRVISKFGKRPVKELLEKIESLTDEVDHDFNLESLHIFLSNNTQEIIKSPWNIDANSIQIADKFSVKPLIKIINRTTNYLILVLSQSGVKLLHAINDGVVAEINNGDFPFSKNLYYLTHHDKLSDGKQVDNMVREFLNTVDKAMVKVFNETNLNCVVVCTEDNYSRLMQVADKPSIYLNSIPIDYNDISNKTLVSQAWELVNNLQKQTRAEAILEMKDAAGQRMVLTDLQEIYKAAKEGRGDLLITHEEFQQAVKMTGEFSFDFIDDVSENDIIDDISSEIAWNVISKNGRAIFTNSEELKTLGDIALKVRY